MAAGDSAFFQRLGATYAHGKTLGNVKFRREFKVQLHDTENVASKDEFKLGYRATRGPHGPPGFRDSVSGF